MHDVTGGAQLVGKREDPGRQTLRVMEEQNLGHRGGSLLR